MRRRRGAAGREGGSGWQGLLPPDIIAVSPDERRGIFRQAQRMLVARRYVISGRVTGVGFRYFVYDVAEREGVTGWARNLFDRRVEVLAEGDAEAITRFEMAIRRGPPGARVDDVETEALPATGRFPGFSIRG